MPDAQEALRLGCAIHVSGFAASAPGKDLIRVGEWCRDHGLSADRYGAGELIGAFEAKVAALLGMPAAAFMVSGTMAQLIALRLWCDRAGVRHVAMHPTAHLELHEERAYAHLHQLHATLLGPRERPTEARDLAACPERLAALVLELPTREIGGQLPTWDELGRIATVARERGTRLHLDGARLWEAREAYATRSFADICALFDSVYVSFYKGIGGLAGAMLLGPEDFIAEARVWRRRQGGTLVQMHPLVASAAMRFDAQLAKMPAYRARARAFAAALGGIDGIVIEPQPPAVNMFHAHFPVPAAALTAARDALAESHGAWLLNRVAPGRGPGASSSEIYVGDNLLALADADLVPLYARLLDRARSIAAATPS
ncbi:MAG: beta-eliminating lyase-related protein [Casimicrobiaceae bacterium]